MRQPKEGLTVNLLWQNHRRVSMKRWAKGFAVGLVALFFVSWVATLPATHADSVLPSGTIQLQPESYLQYFVELQKGDRFEGNFTVTDLIPYQVTNPLAIMMNYSGFHTFGVEIFAFSGITKQKIFDFLNPTADSQYFFNYTADYSGFYVIDFYCSMNNFGPDVKIPKVNFYYNVIEATPLKLHILSPSNQTYIESNVSLSLTINRAVNAMSYSLDGKDNITLNGNITLTGLSDGTHYITVYANDTFGYTDTQTINFTILTTNILAIEVAVVVIIITIAVALLLFRRHRKAVEPVATTLSSQTHNTNCFSLICLSL